VSDMSDFYRVGYAGGADHKLQLNELGHHGSYLVMPIGLEFLMRSQEFLCSIPEINFLRIDILGSGDSVLINIYCFRQVFRQ